MFLSRSFFCCHGVGIAASQTFTQLSGSWTFICLSMGINNPNELQTRGSLDSNTLFILGPPRHYKEPDIAFPRDMTCVRQWQTARNDDTGLCEMVSS